MCERRDGNTLAVTENTIHCCPHFLPNHPREGAQLLGQQRQQEVRGLRRGENVQIILNGETQARHVTLAVIQGLVSCVLEAEFQRVRQRVHAELAEAAQLRAQWTKL